MDEAVAECERQLGDIVCARDLERMLCECFGVDARVPGYEAHHVVGRLGGLGVHPGEMARCFWDVRDRLKGARSFLHVGTGHGHTFVALCLLLWRHAGPRIATHTIDEHNYVLSDVAPIVRPRRSIVRTLASWAAQSHHDVVFVEGGSEDAAALFARPGMVCIHGTADGCRVLGE